MQDPVPRLQAVCPAWQATRGISSPAASRCVEAKPIAARCTTRKANRRADSTLCLCWEVWWWLSAHEFPLTLGDATHLLGSAVNCHLTGAASRCPSRAINLTRRVVRTTKTTTIYIPACHQCGKSISHPKTTVELCGCSAHSRTSTNLTLTTTFTSS